MAETAEGLPNPGSLRSRLDLVLQIEGHRADHQAGERKEGKGVQGPSSVCYTS